MAVKVKDLISFLQEFENWRVSYLEFDDCDGLWASLYNNEKEVPNKYSIETDGPAHEWDHLSIRADKDLRYAEVEFSHENDIFE